MERLRYRLCKDTPFTIDKWRSHFKFVIIQSNEIYIDCSVITNDKYHDVTAHAYPIT